MGSYCPECQAGLLLERCHGCLDQQRDADRGHDLRPLLLHHPADVWAAAHRGLGRAGILALGSCIRCVSMSGHILKITSLLCGALNGWSSIMIECTLTVLSATWFPANERTTATGIVIAVQMSGLIPPALLFPRFVGEPTSDMTDCHSHNTTIIDLKKQISQDVSYIRISG